ncbi:PepSY-associated TM helix domain-containing protein [Alkalihalobacillus trypoxylicola]|uniref:Iron-regulated protein n=1 Tax=Alkalihalobacillus trypoxylicola TaxID=519424 RepID=A0A161QFJ1_9BACI|nr:PepSY domain-containing protein [Alkalihalobacillus trypoxylicola]KYG27639.1 iron-regulated protein [Alkalihalobacillus trypoxylicola]
MNQSDKKIKKGFNVMLFQSIWRWHFYAGIIFAPFIFILAFSGSVYLFKPQIEALLYSDMIFVQEEGEHVLSYNHQLKRVKENFPEAVVQSITITGDEKQTTEISINDQGIAKSVYINPYNGEIQGSVQSDQKLTHIFKKLHSELWIAGTIGNRIVELAASWTIILIMTGLYIWWPRNKKSVWGTVLPRLRKRGRLFWRDLHAVPAFWLSIFILILIATGLPWSGVVGPKIQSLATAPEYAYSFGEKPQSITVTKDIVENVPWTNEQLEVPASNPSSYVSLSIDDINYLLNQQDLKKPYTITLPNGELGVYTASHFDKPKDLATLHLDQYSGAVLSDVRFQDFPVAAKLVEGGIALHEGRLFGWPNQVLGLITCLGLMLIVISSFIMWKKRKPEGGFGLPIKPNSTKANIVVWCIMISFGIVMPLVGLSLIVFFIIDQVIRPYYLKRKVNH